MKRQGAGMGMQDFGVLWVWDPVGIPTGFSVGMDGYGDRNSVTTAALLATLSQDSYG